VRDAGIPEYKRHNCGHGIGLDLYEPPLIKPAQIASDSNGGDAGEAPLETGMILNFEVPYYELGLGAMNLETTVVVTETGYQALTSLEQSLWSVV
jgi:Xaa-Pro aminopeptidase